MHTTSMNLVLRPSTVPGSNHGSLSIRLIHNRRSKTLTLHGCRLQLDEWDKEKQTVVYPQDNPHRVAYLASVEERVNHEKELLGNYLASLEKRGRYSINELVSLYRLRRDQGNLLGFAEFLAREKERRGQVRTARAYRTVTRGLIRFNKGVDIPLSQINRRLIKDFEVHLKALGKLPNTISYYMRNLRAIYTKAVQAKKIVSSSSHPFSEVYTGVTRTMKRALSTEEVKQFYAIDFERLFADKNSSSVRHRAVKALEAGHRYFSFCFYCRGMSFIDLAYLRKENIRGGILRYVRKKTGQQIEMKVTPAMQSVIDYFSVQVRNSSYLFPIIRNPDKNARLQYESALRLQNNRLRKLASLAGISKPVSTHWVRHSWATIAKQQDIPIRVISECLGHTSEKTTLIYLDSLNNSVLDAASDLIVSTVCAGYLSKGA